MTRALPQRAIRMLAPAPKRGLRARLLTSAALAASAVALVHANPAQAQLTTGFQGAPEVVVPSSATVSQNPGADLITVNAPQAVINWTPNDRTGTGTIDFLPVGASARFTGSQEFTVLNRIIPRDAADVPIARMIALNGTITSDVAGGPGGNVWFYSPGGIMVGSGAVINVGSLVLTNRDINTTGGLFGDRNEIRFGDSGIAGTNASEINIASGAQILSNRTDGSAYIALVAPRIIQNGRISADGSVALVAAEAAEVTINNGLFDISVLVGTTDAHGIQHNGVTGGPADHSATYESRAYFVAVPKAQAMTMLLSGTIGFTDARSATVAADGGIVLSAGNNVGGGAPRASTRPGDANISVSDIIFLNNVLATTTGNFSGRPNNQCGFSCDTSSPGGTIQFAGNVDIRAARSIDFGIETSQQLRVGGDMALFAGTAEQGGSINLSLIDNQPPSSTGGGGSIFVTGQLLLSAVGRGSGSVDDSDGRGGTISVLADGGTFTAGSLLIDASGFGGISDLREDTAFVGPFASPMGAPAAGDGGDGIGGTANFTVTNGAAVTLGNLAIRADGVADIYANNGGNGIGGNASLIINNGGRLSVTTTTDVTAIGSGYIGGTSSGDGSGGSVTVDISGIDSALTTGSLNLNASGIGGGAAGQQFDPIDGSLRTGPRGGDGTGGTINLTNSATPSTSGLPGSDLGSITAFADGIGGDSYPTSPGVGAAGGAGQGGTVNFHFTGNNTTVGFDAFITALGVAGQSGGGDGEAGTGGDVNITIDNGATWALSDGLFVDASGINADETGGDQDDLTGGTIGLTLDNGSLNANGLFLIANGESRANGAVSIANSTGASNGGAITITAANASNLNAVNANLSANASAKFATTTGGNATGGTIGINAESASRIILSGLTMNATGAGGSGVTAGFGRGGNANLTTTDATILVRGDASVDVSAESGLASGTTKPGDAQGGNFQFSITGANAQFLANSFSVAANGGALFGTVLGLPGLGGDGRGGDIDFTLDGGNFTVAALDLIANGYGVGGGRGFGGDIDFTLSDGTNSIDTLTLRAMGAGGASGTAADAGSGLGGTIDFIATGGSLTSVAIDIRSDGVGGTVGDDSPGLRGSRLNGADGTGGTVNIQLTGAVLDVSDGFVARADGTGGGGDGYILTDSSVAGDVVPSGRGGNGTGGNVLFNMTGGSVSAGSGPMALALSAAGFGGAGGTILNQITNGSTIILPNNPGGAAGGNGTGGTVTASFEVDNPTIDLTMNLGGTGGNGGGGLTGGNGGRGTGGVASLSANDVDISSLLISIYATGIGGNGADGFNGDGGAGGEGAGGTLTLAATGANASISAGFNGFDLSGTGGSGGTAAVNSHAQTPLTTGFNGGRGGDGKGGSLQFSAVDGALIALNNLFSSSGLRIDGFGGTGGNGAGLLGDGSVATTGGNGGDGGDGYGGSFIFDAQGGTIGYANRGDGTLEVYSFGNAGNAGSGGVGTTKNVLDGNGNVIGTTGGNGNAGFRGIGFGGLVRTSISDTASNEGVIRADSIYFDVSSDIAGRVEIFDNSAGGGFDTGELVATAFGGNLTSGDFTVAGSGIYLTSTNEALQFSRLTMNTGGTIQFDIAGTGGVFVDNVLTANADQFIVNHVDRTDAPSVFANTVFIDANDIFFNDGSFLSTLGDANLTAANDIFVSEANIGNIFTLDAGGNVDIGTSYSYGDTEINAGGDVTLDDVETRTSGVYLPGQTSDLTITAGGDVTVTSSLTGRGIAIDAANIFAGGAEFYAPGSISLTTSNAMELGNITAENNIMLDAGGSINFGSISGDDVSITAVGSIQGDEIFADEGTSLTSTGGNIDVGRIQSYDTIDITASSGDVTVGDIFSEFGDINVVARNARFTDMFASGTIYINASGTIDIERGVTDPEFSGEASLPGGSTGISTMALGEGDSSDIILIAGGAVTVGTLDAANRISINAASLGDANAMLFAGEDIDVRVTGSALFSDMFAATGINVVAGGSITGGNVETYDDGAPVSLDGAQGVSVDTVTSRGTTNLRADNGMVGVNNLTSLGLITVNARSAVLEGEGLLDFDALNTTSGNASVRDRSGDINVRSGTVAGDAALTTLDGDISVQTLTGGNITLDSSDSMTLGAVTARSALNGTAVNLVNVSGIATGATISFVSGDISIGANGRVGTAGTTTGVTLRNGDVTARTFIGGGDQSGEYSLSAAEITRIFGGDITIIGPRVDAQSGGSVGSTRPPDVVIRDFTFNGGGASGGNLSAGGTFSIQTNGAARVIGAVAGNNMTTDNGFEIAADDAIEVILGQGSIRLSGGGSNGLGGTLRLQSADVAVATSTAITDIAAMTDLALIDGRLAQNDGVTDDVGPLSANRLELDVQGGVYIQNSGVDSEYASRRGFTANILAITTTDSNSRIVINGRVGDVADLLQTGVDVIDFTLINGAHPMGQGQFAVGSTINGCPIANPSSCRASFDYDYDSSFPVQDTVNEQVDDDDGTSSSIPQVLIDLREVDDLTDQPIIDEPITGSGNDDLWSPPENMPDNG
ncbi:MAG: hypothetical protein IT553_05605 [Sphingomonadaceae bacterium]|nr:hypothetical protein [Sphingomonadaceae bacterium]